MSKKLTNKHDPLINIKNFMETDLYKQVEETEELKIMTQVLIKRLKEIRKSKSMTQKDLAGIMGVPQPEISRWEKGDTLPSLKAIMKFCFAVNGRLEIIY